ncbi:MAG: radical SAM protein [Actinobacteria bacterium]|nr:radical SAM protein [Actinomycetota bacterium]
MKPKVLLINPNQMKPPVAPLGLEYVGSFLKKHGVEVDLLDLTWEDDLLKAVTGTLNQNSYSIIGISIRNTDDSCFATRDFVLAQSKEIVSSIKKLTKTPVVLGGCGFSIMPKEVFRYCNVDFGIAGDGESIMLELVNSICDCSDYSKTKGLLFWQGSKLVMNEPVYPSFDNDSIIGARGFVDNLRYFTEGGQAGIETKRGCNRNCIYCADPLAKGKKIRTRNNSDVVAEVQQLLEQNIYCFHLCDSEFNIDEEQATEFCHELIRLGLSEKIKWYTYATPKPFTLELARLMKSAGCSGINFGVDSASPKMLETLGKDFGSADIINAAEACHEVGIACMFDLLLGGPNESWETIGETIKLIKLLPVTAVGVNMGIRIYPGTVFAEMVYEEGFSPENPNIHGKIEGNHQLLEPVFYLSSKLGPDVEEHIYSLIGEDNRFMFMSRSPSRKSYNYNQNLVLTEALKKGYRGAYWHILSQINS